MFGESRADAAEYEVFVQLWESWSFLFVGHEFGDIFGVKKNRILPMYYGRVVRKKYLGDSC